MLASAHIPFYGLCLLGTILFYAFAGSPTPDNPGMIEILIGMGLILSVGMQGLYRAIHVSTFETPFLKSLQLLFLYGLIVPSVSCALRGNDHALIFRDITAFMFLGLPLFLSLRMSKNLALQQGFLAVLLFCGVSFSLRTLLPVFNIWVPQGELLYLSNSPIVMMTAIYLAASIWKNFELLTTKSFGKAFIMMGILGVVLAAMLLDVQRATIGSVLFSTFIIVAADVWQKPKRAVWGVIFIAVIFMVAWPWFEQTFEIMALKTAHVGMNSRVAEAIAVYEFAKTDPVTFLFGHGWGAVFSSPAVAGLEVNYTHSLLTTILLKGGIVMLILTIWVVAMALYEIFLIFQRDKAKGLAIFWAFIIPVFLYASHKSLDFGLILLLMSVWSIPTPTLQNNVQSVRKKDIQQGEKDIKNG